MPIIRCVVILLLLSRNYINNKRLRTWEYPSS
jgi:hypothetical protein